ncbi:hypothetical protein [Streptomyces bauhiniae]
MRSRTIASDDGFYTFADPGPLKARHPGEGDTPRKVVHIVSAAR